MSKLSRIGLEPVAVMAAFAVMVAAPFMLREYHLELLILFCINAILIASYRVVTTTGDWTLSHVIFMGCGAYSTGILAKYLGWPFWLTLPMSGVATAVIGIMVAFPLLRTKGFGIFIASFAIGEFIRHVWIKFHNPFGGPRGMIGIPTIEIGDIDFYDSINFYFMTLAIAVVCLAILYRLDKSRIGKAWKVIYLDEDLAESIGIHVFNYRAKAFVVAAFFAGIAGALLAHRLEAIDPHNFDIETMVYLIIWIVVGGNATFWGPLAGLAVMTLIFEWARPLHEWRPLLFGGILIMFLTILPGGLERIYEQVKTRIVGRNGGGG